MDGIAFKDMAIGHQVSLGKTTTEADILMFGAISRDANPVHLDAAVAATTPFKTRIAPGLPPPGLPSPGLPSPGLPSPGLPSPGLPSPGLPSPGLPLAGLIGAVMGPKLRGSIYLSQTLTCRRPVHIGHTVTITTPHAKTGPATPRKICAGTGKKFLTRGTTTPMHSAA